MDLPAILAVALALAMDAFAVAVAAGLTVAPLTGRHIFRLSFHFGLFQFLMPVIGWLAGQTVAGAVHDWSQWLAFAFLAGIGGKMLYESWARCEDQPRNDPTRGLTLVVFSIATSIDALAVGLSIALLKVAIWVPSVIIGLMAGGLTWAGILLGRRVGQCGQNCGRWAERVGGAVLIVLGVRIAVARLLGVG